MVCLLVLGLSSCAEVSYELNFMVDDELWDVVSTAGEETITMPDDPEKEGYVFDGWYWDKAFERPLTAQSLLDAKLTKDMSVYAKFIKESEVRDTHTVRFDSKGGNAVDPRTVTDGENTSEPVKPELTGYRFLGWYRDEGCTQGWNFARDTVTEDITLYAKWETVSYRITYQGEKGAVNTNPSDYTIESETILLSEIAAEGYTFDGWFDKNGAEVTEIASGRHEDITLEARWTAREYTLSVTSGENGSVTGSGRYAYDSTVTLCATAEEGYCLQGWYRDGEFLSPAPTYRYRMGLDATVTAKFETHEFTYRSTTATCTRAGISTYACKRCNAEEQKEEAALGHTCQLNGYCRRCGSLNFIRCDKDGTINENGEYVLFGMYPQSLIEDEVKNSENFEPSWAGYAVWRDPDTHERVYYKGVVASPQEAGYKFSNGEVIEEGEMYWFKVEPIRWRIATEKDGTAMLVCDSIIATGSWDTIEFFLKEFYTYDSAWEWGGFSNAAFSEEAYKAIVPGADGSNPIRLLTWGEVQNSDYGFSTHSQNAARHMMVSDYARACGAYIDTRTWNYGRGYWKLAGDGGYVKPYGEMALSNAPESIGVVPTLWLKW